MLGAVGAENTEGYNLESTLMCTYKYIEEASLPSFCSFSLRFLLLLQANAAFVSVAATETSPHPHPSSSSSSSNPPPPPM